MSRVAGKPPRGLVLAQLEADREPPDGRRPISTRERNQRGQQVVGLLAHGHIPLDNTTADVLSGVMESELRKARRAMR